MPCPKSFLVKNFEKPFDLYVENSNNVNALIPNLKKLAVRTDKNTSSIEFIILACLGFGKNSLECKRIYCNKSSEKLCDSKKDYAHIYYKEKGKNIRIDHNFIIFMDYNYTPPEKSETKSNVSKLIDRVIILLGNSIDWLKITSGKIFFHIIIYGDPAIFGMDIGLQEKFESELQKKFSKYCGKGPISEIFLRSSNEDTLTFFSSNPARIQRS
jgi:hypothetical protein